MLRYLIRCRKSVENLFFQSLRITTSNQHMQESAQYVHTNKNRSRCTLEKKSNQMYIMTYNFNNKHYQKYSRLKCLLLRVKNLVICFYLGWSGSILQFRQNIIKVGSKSRLLTCQIFVTTITVEDRLFFQFFCVNHLPNLWLSGLGYLASYYEVKD